MTPNVRPRFRTDLVAEPIDDGGHRFIDVIDPDNGNVFRFYDVEYSIACAMDGERDVPGLVRWAKEELGIEPSPSELATVITTLGDLGYLDSGAAGSGAHDQELVRGVVSAPRGAAPKVEDVELGVAGSVSPREEAPLVAEQVELGTAGAHTKPTARASASVPRTP